MNVTFHLVLFVSWPTDIGLRCLKSRFGATCREDRNRDFSRILGGLESGDDYPSLCCFGKTAMLFDVGC